ncbi:hypothetical protein [Embleya sp. NPDC050493]|uniref:hypothetical protein n=1 Tax=Embleya sp. NPDC050493 TaxID=3363989 RepID=UPI00378A421E
MQVRVHESTERVFLTAADGRQVICTDQPLTLDRPAAVTGQDTLDAAVLRDPFGERLPAGAWLLPPELPLRPRRALVALVLPGPAGRPSGSIRAGWTALAAPCPRRRRAPAVVAADRRVVPGRGHRRRVCLNGDLVASASLTMPLDSDDRIEFFNAIAGGESPAS